MRFDMTRTMVQFWRASPLASIKAWRLVPAQTSGKSSFKSGGCRRELCIWCERYTNHCLISIPWFGRDSRLPWSLGMPFHNLGYYPLADILSFCCVYIAFAIFETLSDSERAENCGLRMIERICFTQLMVRVWISIYWYFISHTM